MKKTIIILGCLAVLGLAVGFGVPAIVRHLNEGKDIPY